MPEIRKAIWLSSFWLLVSSQNLFGSACCSGGSSLPAIILNDDRWAFRLASSNSFTVGDVEDDGQATWRRDSFNEQLFSLAPSFVYRWGDFWQTGLKASMQRRSLSESSHWGVGDSSLHISYEPFPLYTYSAWRPRFLMVGSLSMPTGRSSYDTTRELLKATGTGFWAPSLTFIFSKTLGDFDLLLSGEAKYQVERSFRYEKVRPGWIFNSKIGSGYSWSRFRFGITAGPTYEEKRRLLRSRVESPSKMLWDAQFDVSSLITSRVSAVLAYNDQTLLGPAWNVALERSLALSLILHGI